MDEAEKERQRAAYRVKVEAARAAEEIMRAQFRARAAAAAAPAAPPPAPAAPEAPVKGAGRGAKGLAAAAARKAALSHIPRKAVVVPTRYTPAARAILAARAQEAGLSIGAFTRKATVGDAGPRSRRAVPVDAEAAVALLVDMKRTGNVLNQIAKAMHMHMPVLTDRALAAVDEMHRAFAAVTAAYTGKGPGPCT